MPGLSIIRNFLALVLLSLAATQICMAQPPGGQPDLTIDAATRTSVIESIIKRLNESYVFPDVAKKMEASIRDRADKKEYEQISSAKSFAETLTKDLQAVSNDKHLRVRYSYDPIPVRQQRREPTAAEREESRRDFNWMNHSFNKVERLRGNIGYIEFRGFFDPEFGG